ncbi:hypothetical protein B7C42_06654 [Nocardia cerradoensis]|uniref:Dienelactone hydrolase domain-containing protein n=1 Tax=Nocardia cerradoensis TaxID=85688 RepID=A0A231GXC5_9NOCA|nr:dienelactone hydrolase family protein [Nocardia cerradoensis]OXR41256.1 hypothetical protein B7C42_06654 [Nocardia cerradoensis]
MDEPVLIQPTASILSGSTKPVPALDISLGGTPRGLVVLICERGALNREGPGLMNRLAEHGYESLAVEAGSVDASDLDVLMARADDRNWIDEQIGLVGVGHGGSAVFEAAAQRELAAAVSISPAADGPGLLDFDDVVRTPWLGLFGDADPSVSADDRRALASRLAARSQIYTEVVSYPGVGRDFYRYGDDGPGYAAYYDSWQRTVEWLDARVAPRPTARARRWRRCRLETGIEQDRP